MATLAFHNHYRFLLSVSLLTIFMSLTDSLPPCHDGHTAPTTPLLSFLERAQETARITFGDKNFVPKRYLDMPLKYNLNKTLAAFDTLLNYGKVSVKEFESFMTDYFEDAWGDMVYHEPEDFVPKPRGFLPNVESLEVREWALEVHSLRKNLSRKVSDDVKMHPDLHTLLPLPRPFIVPGSSFQEAYYWDSYWIIRGLLASKMYETAKAIVTNLIYLLDTYGRVLNGARSC